MKRFSQKLTDFSFLVKNLRSVNFTDWTRLNTKIFFSHSDFPPRRFSATAIFRRGDFFPQWRFFATAIFIRHGEFPPQRSYSAMAEFRHGFKLWRNSARMRIFTAMPRHRAENFFSAPPRPATEKFWKIYIPAGGCLNCTNSPSVSRFLY